MRVKVRLKDTPAKLKDFWIDWDFRQEKVTGVPRHFLGQGHPIPVFGPLPPKKEPKNGL